MILVSLTPVREQAGTAYGWMYAEPALPLRRSPFDGDPDPAPPRHLPEMTGAFAGRHRCARPSFPSSSPIEELQRKPAPIREDRLPAVERRPARGAFRAIMIGQ